MTDLARLCAIFLIYAGFVVKFNDKVNWGNAASRSIVWVEINMVVNGLYFIMLGRSPEAVQGILGQYVWEYNELTVYGVNSEISNNSVILTCIFHTWGNSFG